MELREGTGEEEEKAIIRPGRLNVLAADRGPLWISKTLPIPPL
jgi:hypothetical protein